MLICNGVFSTTNNKPSVSLSNWAVSLEAGNPCAQFKKYLTAAAGTPFDAGGSNAFYLYTDLEHYSNKGSGGGFFSGINTTSGSSYVRLSFAAATTDQCTMLCFCLHDTIISYDIPAQSAKRMI